MRRLVSWTMALSLAGLSGGCATGRSVSVTGRRVEITPRAEADDPAKVKGELLAVDTVRIWVLGKEQLVTLPLGSVREVKVQRHGLTARRVGLWSVIGAVVTGGALAIACSSVEGNEGCGKIFLAVGATWGVVGALAAPALQSSSEIPIRHPKTEDLQPYARFPQGLPEGVSASDLGPHR
jgi:hypothetical protein